MNRNSNQFSLAAAYLNSISTEDLVSTPAIVGRTIRDLLSQFGTPSCSTSLALQDLELAFGKSISLGFSLWQHMAALDRLSSLPDWLAVNEAQWSALRTGVRICGLATTHLSSPVTIRGTATPDGYSLSGSAKWVTGCDFFDDLIVGFEIEEAYCFALIPFPRSERVSASTSTSVTIAPLKLAALESTSTGVLHFDNFLVLKSQLISRREKNAKPTPRKSTLRIPELGVAKAVVDKIRFTLETKTQHPLRSEYETALGSLDQRLAKLESSRDDESLDLTAECHLAIRDSIRIFSLISGSSSIYADSEASRLATEAMLFDIILQSENSMRTKIAVSVCRLNN